MNDTNPPASIPRSEFTGEQVRAAYNAEPAGPVRIVAYEFLHPNGHAIVDYTEHTHIGHLSAAKGYKAHPLTYADIATSPAALTDEQIEFGLNNHLEDPSDDESRAFIAGAKWAAARGLASTADRVRWVDEGIADAKKVMPESIALPLADAQMLLSWMDKTFGNGDGLDWQDEDAAAVGDALSKAIDNFKLAQPAITPLPRDFGKEVQTLEVQGRAAGNPLRDALRLIADTAEGSTTANSLPNISQIARAALAA